MANRRGAGRRRGLRVLIALGVVVLLAAMLVVNVWSPPSDEVPEHVDAVVQLGGVKPETYEVAREYGEQGVTPEVLLSNVRRDYPARADALCAPATGFRVECFDPEPPDTRGEAQRVGEMARERGWHSVYVIAADEAHVTRARFVVSRCLPEGVALKVGFRAVGRTHRERVKQWVYQTGAWGKALVENGC